MQPNNNPAPTTNYTTALGEVASTYDPEQAQTQAQLDQAVTARNTNLSELSQNQQTSLSQLDQAKANAFSNNALTSNARGIMYSGYTPATNNAYVTNTYNPNVDKVNTTYSRGVDTANTNFNNTQQSLTEKINQINQDRANAANTVVLNTQSAQQEAAKEAASAAQASAKASQPSQNQIASAISSGLAKVTGQDGYVSPEDYASAYTDWINAGYSASSFNSTFKSFQNPNNNYYKYAVTQAIKRS